MKTPKAKAKKKSQSPTKAELNSLFQMATNARKNSHSPYSHHKVGSAIALTNGKTFAGCNVENASYGGTVCAERVAIWKAVSEEGSKCRIDTVVVVTDQLNPWSPCGFCRQVIAEFSTAQTMIHLANLKGIQRSLSFAELFPEGFTPDQLTAT